MATLPMDIILEEILRKLPIKSLLRYRSVCKTFNTHISNPEFIINKKRLVILNTTKQGLDIFDFDDSLESSLFHCPFPINLNLRNRSVHHLGSCNGLLCLGTHSLNLMLLNPLTGDFLRIPEPTTYTGFFRNQFDPSGFGFGFDSWNNDYKLVFTSPCFDTKVAIYSVKSKSWRSTEASASSRRSSLSNNHANVGVLIGSHLLHWLFADWQRYINQNEVPIHEIKCFDITTELWVNMVPLPQHCHDEVLKYELGKFDGCLCLFIRVSRAHLVDMWVMKEYGVKESWVKLLGIDDICVTQTLRMFPLGYYGNGIVKEEILLSRGPKHMCSGGERVVLIWYNLKDKKCRLSNVHEIHGVSHFFDAFTCTGSLAPIPTTAF